MGGAGVELIHERGNSPTGRASLYLLNGDGLKMDGIKAIREPRGVFMRE